MPTGRIVTVAPLRATAVRAQTVHAGRVINVGALVKRATATRVETAHAGRIVTVAPLRATATRASLAHAGRIVNPAPVRATLDPTGLFRVPVAAAVATFPAPSFMISMSTEATGTLVLNTKGQDSLSLAPEPTDTLTLNPE